MTPCLKIWGSLANLEGQNFFASKTQERRSRGNTDRLFKLAQENVVRRTDRPAMTFAVDLGRKATKQTNKQPHLCLFEISENHFYEEFDISTCV